MGKNKKSEKITKLKYDVDEKDFVQQSTKFSIDFKARNQKQQIAWRTMDENSIIFLIGKVGSGKTKLGTLKAMSLLESKKFKRVVLLRPTTVSDTEQLGFLKGDMDDKIAPLVLPMRACIEEEIGKLTYEALQEKGMIQPYSLGHIEGLTYKNTVVLLDEVQNTTPEVLKMVMTRIDDSSKLIIMGDKFQIKLKDKRKSAILDIDRFRDKELISFIEFEEKDIVRGKITKIVESCYPEDNEKESGFIGNGSFLF